jgi:hypothetical protein
MNCPVLDDPFMVSFNSIRIIFSWRPFLYLGLILITFVHMIFPFLFFYIMSVDNVVISIGLQMTLWKKK